MCDHIEDGKHCGKSVILGNKKCIIHMHLEPPIFIPFLLSIKSKL